MHLLRGPLVVAQSLVEYGTLSAAIAKGQEFLYEAETWVAGVTPQIWAGLGVAVAIVLFILRRRRRSVS